MKLVEYSCALHRTYSPEEAAIATDSIDRMGKDFADIHVFELTLDSIPGFVDNYAKDNDAELASERIDDVLGVYDHLKSMATAQHVGVILFANTCGLLHHLDGIVRERSVRQVVGSFS